ncbi:hypothetical protein LI328DRAFT_166797 [Trichoderma asperelloides]|nr:hypothetical protein LI328DRAFT_166797 [Trichoderma asperelloides]
MTSRAAPIIYDALVVGSGPTGLSTALTLARYRNHGAKEMHTYLSRDEIPPESFRSISQQQIEEKYSGQVSFKAAKIVTVSNAEVLPRFKGFQAVDSANNTYLGHKLVLATGTEDVIPTDIEGYAENWPHHLQDDRCPTRTSIHYHCPFCDVHEQKDYPIGMLTFPNPSYAHFALMTLSFNKDFTIYSNGPVLASGIKLDQRKVLRLINNGEDPENGITIEFDSGSPAKLGMLLHRPPTRSRGQSLIDYVPGDTQESLKQALMASSNGLRVGASFAYQLVDEEGNRAVEMLEEREVNL